MADLHGTPNGQVCLMGALTDHARAGDSLRARGGDQGGELSDSSDTKAPETAHTVDGMGSRTTKCPAPPRRLGRGMIRRTVVNGRVDPLLRQEIADRLDRRRAR
jgi:hypothetical protein